MHANLDLSEPGRRVLDLLDGTRKSLLLYPPDHPVVGGTLRHLEHVLNDLFMAFSEVTLSVLDGEFYLNDFALKRETAAFQRLAEHLVARDATSITFLPEVTVDELQRLWLLLNLLPDDLRERGGASDAVASLGLAHVRVARVRAGVDSKPVAAADVPEELRRKISSARVGYETAVASMQSVFQMVGSDGHVDYRTIKTTTEALLDSVVTNRNVWTHLLNVKHTDEYSYNHSVNVATLSLLLATRFGVTPGGLSVLAEAALLHDLGKQKVPREILQKPAALTDDEWIEMRSHPEKGAKILLGVRDVSEAAVMVAYEHHVRYDHKGYPRTRGRRDLHLFSHLVAVADIYDALTSDRGYRRALVPDMAMRIILSQSGTAFHPLVVTHFINLVGVYPVGTFVKLASGEIALVQHNQSRDLLRPVVLVVYDATGTAISPVTRDLLDEPAGELPVQTCIDPVALGIDLGKLR